MGAPGHDHDADPVSPRQRRLLALLLAPFLVATLIGLVALWPSAPRSLAGGIAPEDLVRAKVVGVERGPCPGTTPEAELNCSVPTVRLLEGPDESEVVQLEPQSEGPGAIVLELDDEIVLGYFPDSPAGFQYSFADFDRQVPLLVLGGLFVLSVLALGRLQGLRALLGLAVSLGVLVVFVLPALLEGTSPLAVSLVGASAVGVVALYLAHGVNARTTVALLGTLASLALVGALGAVFVEAAVFTGTDESALVITTLLGPLDLRGLVLGGIVIGTLGVLDDVTVTQVSAVQELQRADPGASRRQLFGSALRIGRDHIASTVNTLVLAYAGASLPLLLLFRSGGLELTDVLTSEVVAVEVVRTLVGSIGLVASVPLTTALAAWLLGRPDETPTRQRSRNDPRGYRGRKEERFWAEAEGLPPGRAEAPESPG
jgi:uncharacterized membrane protein